MNLDHYKELLLAKERELANRRVRTAAEEQETGDGGAEDVGDASVKDEQKAILFTEGEADATVVEEVRLALARIADGSYGRCLVDEAPIPEARLEAVPWARYCAKHQSELEAAEGLRTPSL